MEVYGSEDLSKHLLVGKLKTWVLRLREREDHFGEAQLHILRHQMLVCSSCSCLSSSIQSRMVGKTVLFFDRRTSIHIQKHSFHFMTAGKGHSFSERVKQRDQDYYSTYHNAPRRKFSEEEWEKFTRQSTSAALAVWASTPEVIKWIGNNAHRMRLIEEDHNQDDTSESDSDSDSPKETVPRNESEPSFFTWLWTHVVMLILRNSV